MKHKIICNHVIPALKSLPDEHVDMLMTSVPYWDLRDYGEDTATDWQDGWHGQLGLEPTPELYIEHLRWVFAEVKRVLKKTGTCWVNIGDSYAGSSKGIGSSPDPKWKDARNDNMKHKTDWDGVDLPAKCMCMMSERFAFMMVDGGYILRNKIIWHKPNPMPSSVKDRFNTTYEMLYFFSKSHKYWFDLDAVRGEHKTPLKERESFNYRVREAKKGHFGIVGVKSNEEEMFQYDTKGKHGVIRQSWAEETGQSESYHGVGYQNNGKNPGDFWNINTQPFPEAHFAVFPEKLCEKPILAGCPAEVCSVCGMARVRITKPTGNTTMEHGSKKMDIAVNRHEKRETLSVMEYKTIGWTDCPCLEENKYEPGIIIDPFGGSGTVGVVAEKLSRSSILIDIKKDYCEMALKRLQALVGQTKLTKKQSTIQKIGF